jgi:tetratricopeptide (TPR) repeat protein
MSEIIDQLLRGAYAARQDHRPADAKRLLIDAVELCREAEDRERLPVALTALGQAERALHRLEAARQHYEEAAAIYRADGPALRFAHTVRHIGDIHLESGQLALAEPLYKTALDLYRKHREAPPLDVANMLRSMAILKGELGETRVARLLWEEAGALYASVNVEAGVEESKRRIAILSQSV